MSRLNKIISGGQTGADTGALVAARELGIETGGFAPRGWLTETGPQEAALRRFGLVECDEPGYPARTRRNVIHADGTLIMGPHGAGGTRLTCEIASELKKPVFLVARKKLSNLEPDPLRIEDFRDWLSRHDIQVLNVAGPRESESPGIAEFTRQFLVVALGGVE